MKRTLRIETRSIPAAIQRRQNYFRFHQLIGLYRSKIKDKWRQDINGSKTPRYTLFILFFLFSWYFYFSLFIFVSCSIITKISGFWICPLSSNKAVIIIILKLSCCKEYNLDNLRYWTDLIQHIVLYYHSIILLGLHNYAMTNHNFWA